MSPKAIDERHRDANRSRQAILDAAEALFAERGFSKTSLSEIGEAAGVSRGTPGYFFHSKEGLYEAVLARCFEQAQGFLEVAGARAAPAQDPADSLSPFIEGYLQFLAQNPRFVKLVEWEARTGGRHLEKVAAHLEALATALEAIRSTACTQGPAGEPVQLLLSVMGMCWFPFSQADTLMRALGKNPADAAFLEARQQHIVALLMQGVQTRAASFDS